MTESLERLEAALREAREYIAAQQPVWAKDEDMPPIIHTIGAALAASVTEPPNHAAARLEEAKWWAENMVDYDNPGAEFTVQERIAELERAVAEKAPLEEK